MNLAYEAPKIWRVQLADDDLAIVAAYKYNYCSGLLINQNEAPAPLARGGSGPCIVKTSIAS